MVGGSSHICASAGASPSAVSAGCAPASSARSIGAPMEWHPLRGHAARHCCSSHSTTGAAMAQCHLGLSSLQTHAGRSRLLLAACHRHIGECSCGKRRDPTTLRTEKGPVKTKKNCVPARRILKISSFLHPKLRPRAEQLRRSLVFVDLIVRYLRTTYEEV